MLADIALAYASTIVLFVLYCMYNRYSERQRIATLTKQLHNYLKLTDSYGTIVSYVINGNSYMCTVQITDVDGNIIEYKTVEIPTSVVYV